MNPLDQLLNRTIIPARNLKPGTAIIVPSDYPGVMHWGVTSYGFDSDGNPFVWHSQKSDVLRVTSFLEFSGGKSCDIHWVPENPDQALRVIQRLKSKAGLPWHLTKANCEMVVRWAIEGRPVSHQIGVGVVAALGLGIAIAVASSK